MNTSTSRPPALMTKQLAEQPFENYDMLPAANFSCLIA